MSRPSGSATLTQTASTTGWSVTATRSKRLSAEEAAREDVMLGMRLVRGVAWSQVQSAHLTEILEQLAADGLVELANDAVSRPGPRWRTTQRGWLLGNEVFSRIWTGE